MRGRVIRLGALVLALSLLLVLGIYIRDMAGARGRVEGRSMVMPSPYGDIEYTERGSGPAVLIVHGSGGGFDQGELIAGAVLDDRFRQVTPSRFGYLRSTFRDGATFEDQAHAYAALLDALEIHTVAVVALSHGGPSALLFAALYPERVTSLTLISAGVAASASADQADANRRGDMLTIVFGHDPLYWAASRLFRGRLMELMGADRAIVSGMSPEQRRLADQMIDFMNPVSRRSAGVVFDNGAAMPNERIAAVRAPTLVLHATDDALQLFHNAEFAAATIPDVRLIRFDRGGHFLAIVEQSRVRAATVDHILAHLEDPPH
jgi:2-hydroxy-6-oxonona-2,4-dienedioate hydrolase